MKKRTQTSVAVVKAGEKNLTRITGLRPLTEATLDDFAKRVAKRPVGIYYVMEFSERGMQRKKGDPLYVWYVGDGFSHAEGWWTETE